MMQESYGERIRNLACTMYLLLQNISWYKEGKLDKGRFLEMIERVPISVGDDIIRQLVEISTNEYLESVDWRTGEKITKKEEK